ncbi:ABC transporter permease [Isosphaeraceae bacterium EP7]
MRRLAALIFWLAVVAVDARGHDIPNARVDRSIQARIEPGRLIVEYEVSLAELTLVQDLRGLAEIPPNLDRRSLFEIYAQVTGPLNAKGLLVSVDGAEIALKIDRSHVVVEGHPRFEFRMIAGIPPKGRLRLQDTNYAASEGTSRLAIAGEPGITLTGDELSANVGDIPIRAVWELSDSEEKRTKQVEVFYVPSQAPGPVRTASNLQVSEQKPPRPEEERGWLSRQTASLLDAERGWSVAALILIAIGLGAAHSLQPGHGKSLVAAVSVGRGGGRGLAFVLASAVTLTHTGAVIAVAGLLRATRTARYAEIDDGLTRVAGFLIAAIGAWKLGRWVSGVPEHAEAPTDDLPPMKGAWQVAGLGLVAGLVPCWDAISLIVLAEALGRLGLGLILLIAFGLGMGLVLATVAWASGRIVPSILGPKGRGSRALGLAAGLVILGMGLYLLNGSGTSATGR